jgi:hypothetical protein
MAVDLNKLQEFLGRFVADLGATLAAGNVVIGHRLGLYRALAADPANAAELAERTGTSSRYIAEWLRGQAAGGYVEYDPATVTYSMTEEQADPVDHILGNWGHRHGVGQRQWPAPGGPGPCRAAGTPEEGMTGARGCAVTAASPR